MPSLPASQVRSTIARIGRLVGAEVEQVRRGRRLQCLLLLLLCRRLQSGCRLLSECPLSPPPASQPSAYPGWAPNPTSEVVQLTATAIGKVTGGFVGWGGGWRQAVRVGMLAARADYAPFLACPVPLPCLPGAQPKVTAIHAGLECGILLEKLPGLDVVSYGPTITCAGCCGGCCCSGAGCAACAE